jgi:hypothetical protein
MTHAPEPLLDVDDLRRLHEALTTAGYTTNGLTTRLGEAVVQAIERGQSDAALPAVADDDRRGSLLRMFLYCQAIPTGEAAAALNPLSVESAVAAGLVEPWEGSLRARVQLIPYRDRWFLADAPASASRPLATDHVVGLSAYPATLAAAHVPGRVATALDVCSGSGVQALHLTGRADRVTATDLNPRALRLAATTAALAGEEWELLLGDFLEPVRGRRFDLVVANPPFIVKPGAVDYRYRDSGHPLDSLGAELAAAAPELLDDGGFMQYLAAFVQVKSEDWTERVAAWAHGTGLDAHFVQLGTADPATYVRTWSMGHGTSPKDQVAWLNWLAGQRIETIGWGLVTLRRSGRDDPSVRVEQLPGHGIKGLDIAAWFHRQDWLRDHRHELLRTALRPAAGLTLAQQARLDGTDGWAVTAHQISVPGTSRTDEVGQLVVDFIECCDGMVTPEELIAKLATVNDLDPAHLEANLVAALTLLVEHGLLLPNGPDYACRPSTDACRPSADMCRPSADGRSQVRPS